MLERPALAAFHDHEPAQDDLAGAVIDGLSCSPKSLPCKFFYDRRGSRLFEEICELAEYYPTRTETRLLEASAGEIATLAGPSVHLVEFGSGAGHKVRRLLAALRKPRAYTAIDISREHLLEATTALARSHPGLHVTAICADYSKPFRLGSPRGTETAKRVGFFPGSTIGNLTPQDAVGFLREAAAVLGPGGDFIIGVDLKKDPRILHAAYNDAKGVTAAFNLNLLVRINRELGANFDLARFRHQAHYDAREGRIEMHLASEGAQTVRVLGRAFHFADGETIHTENSYKYSVDEFRAVAADGGFIPMTVWTDPGALFSVHYLRAT